MSRTRPHAHPGPGQPCDTEVDLLVIGSGTGMAAALAGWEVGLEVLLVESTEYIGGSTALSGGAFWIPNNFVLRDHDAYDTPERANTYLDAVVGDSAPAERRRAYIEHGPAAVEMMRRLTPMRFQWNENYSDYHPEQPGGSAAGRTCESEPFDLRGHLRQHRELLRPTALSAPVPMPITAPDYRLMNLMAKLPVKGVGRVLSRAAQGIGGLAMGREYVAGGQAIAGGLFAGLLHAGIPFWLETPLIRLVADGDRVTGAVLGHDGREVTVTARRGVVLAAGGFDHDMAWRHEVQSPSLGHWTHGSPGSLGRGISAAMEVGAAATLLDQAWWFPSIAPVPGKAPTVMLAERSLPGSFMVGGDGRRFINEAVDYMSFGQEWLRREREGHPIGDMWIVFDQEYMNSYVFGTVSFPRMPLPQEWYANGIAVTADAPAQLARAMRVPEAAFVEQAQRFDDMASTGSDWDFGRGNSRYDNYYGDPTVSPNPNLRPLEGKLYAVRVVLSDLGTCGGLVADGRARVRRPDGSVIDGLYAIGNTAGNAFGASYPGAGATIGQGLVFGMLAAEHAATGASDHTGTVRHS